MDKWPVPAYHAFADVFMMRSFLNCHGKNADPPTMPRIHVMRKTSLCARTQGVSWLVSCWVTVLFARSIVSCSGCYSGESLSVVRVLWRDYYTSSLTRPKDLTASHLSRQLDPFASEMTIASSSVFFMWIPLSLRPNFIHRFIVVSAMSQFCPLYNGK